MNASFQVFGHKVTIDQAQADNLIYSECLVIDMVQDASGTWRDGGEFWQGLEIPKRGTHIDIEV